MTTDEMNERLRMGWASPDEARAFCAEWNASGKHFLRAEVFGGKILMLDDESPPQTLKDRSGALNDWPSTGPAMFD